MGSFEKELPSKARLRIDFSFCGAKIRIRSAEVLNFLLCI